MAATSLTKKDARSQIESFLRDTLSGMPDTVFFSARDPEFGGEFGSGHTVPCDDDDTKRDPQWAFNVSYWVVGVPGEQTEQYMARFGEIWAGRGWRVHQDRSGPMRSVTAMMRDGYAFTVRDAGQGILSLAASSPCFPAHDRDNGAMPPVIRAVNGTY